MKETASLLIDISSNNTGVILLHHHGHTEITPINKESNKENITYYIEELLSKNQLNLNSIDEFWVSIGPGSFTSIRIALATLKTISYFLKKPLKIFNSLDFFSLLSKKNTYTLIIIKSTLKTYFLSLYDKNNSPIYGLSYKLYDLNTINLLITFLPHKINIITDNEIDISTPFKIIDPLKLKNTNFKKKLLHKNITHDSIFEVKPMYMKQSEAEYKNKINIL